MLTVVLRTYFHGMYTCHAKSRQTTYRGGQIKDLYFDCDGQVHLAKGKTGRQQVDPLEMTLVNFYLTTSTHVDVILQSIHRSGRLLTLMIHWEYLPCIFSTVSVSPLAQMQRGVTQDLKHDITLTKLEKSLELRHVIVLTTLEPKNNNHFFVISLSYIFPPSPFVFFSFRDFDSGGVCGN